MSKKLCGISWAFQANKYDYNFIETIQCLLECCDYVIVGAGGNDGTLTDVLKIKNDKLKVIEITQEQWDEQHGREKLSYFANVCIEEAERLGYEYQFYCQADEILTEKSYDELRKAIQAGCEGYLMKRINLWASPYMRLEVPHERKPVSTEIVRLTKSCYRAYDDAESIAAPVADAYFLEGLRIYHMGFVRKREIHPQKIRTMQGDIFKCGIDPKLDGMDIFDPYQWFSKEDLVPIDEPLPKLIQAWARERHYED